MSTSQEASNKAILRSFHAAASTGDLEVVSSVIDELVAPDLEMSTPLPIEATGAEALKEVFARLLGAFPDLQVNIEDLIAEGDKVVSRNRVTGTHLGEYMGLAGTGKSVEYKEIFVVRIENGRIAETWGVVDVAAQMRQLGLIPA